MVHWQVQLDGHSVPHMSRNCVQLKHALPLESQINVAWRTIILGSLRLRTIILPSQSHQDLLIDPFNRLSRLEITFDDHGASPRQLIASTVTVTMHFASQDQELVPH